MLCYQLSLELIGTNQLRHNILSHRHNKSLVDVQTSEKVYTTFSSPLIKLVIKLFNDLEETKVEIFH